MLLALEESIIANLGDERAVTCYVTKLYRFVEERNAWQWTTSRTYDGSFAYHESLGQAKKEVEQRRVQGSSWEIQEVPSLVVSGGNLPVIIAASWTSRPFTGLKGIVIESPLMRAILKVVRDAESEYVIYSNRAPAWAEYPFRSFRSFVEGPGLPLGWFPSAEKHGRDLSGLHEVMQKIQDAMQLR